jgi:hypothetical protein
MKPVTRKFRRLWLVVVVLAVLVPCGFVAAALQFQASVNTSGNIKAVGISVYSDSLGTVVATKVDWGMVAPGQTVTATLYLKSTSKCLFLLVLLWGTLFLLVGKLIWRVPGTIAAVYLMQA